VGPAIALAARRMLNIGPGRPVRLGPTQSNPQLISQVPCLHRTSLTQPTRGSPVASPGADELHRGEGSGDETQHRECVEELPGHRRWTLIRRLRWLKVGRHRARLPLNDRQSYQQLPRRIKPTETVTSHLASPARDPEGGRDTNRDFVIRYGDPFD
jgi:hypothetical protein